MKDYILIDGSFGEGGGQIFRTALAYSAIVQKPVKIINIRAKRKNPGLRPQHLSALEALAVITKAKIRGGFIGSKEVYFEPQGIYGGKFTIDPKTAGSISLIIQAILPSLLFADKDSQVIIKGGTDVPFAPPIDTIKFVFIPLLWRLSADIKIEVKRRGHYPRGGGIVYLEVKPIKKPLKPIKLMEQGTIEKILGISHCVKLPKHVSERQAKSASEVLMQNGYENLEISIEWYPPEKDPHLGPGSGIVLWAKTNTNALLVGDELGKRGIPAEIVGKNAAIELIKQIEGGGAVDVHNTDQLIPYMALADGISEISSSEISLHTLTAIYVAEKVLNARFNVEKGSEHKPSKITVKGIGYI